MLGNHGFLLLPVVLQSCILSVYKQLEFCIHLTVQKYNSGWL